MRILLVEDDPMIATGICRGLRSDGFAVDWARDGEAGDSALASTTYDALLLDLGLPGRDGIDLLSGWRRRGIDLPVLVITGDTSPGDLSLLSASGLQVLHKPFRAEALLAAIEQVLATAEAFGITAARAAPGSPASRRG